MKLGTPREESFPRTTELMRALTYVIRKAQALGMPVAVNLSFGNTYGSHRGASLVERFLDNSSEVWKNVICVGSGNEGASMGHTSGTLNGMQEIELSVGDYEASLNVQLWKEYSALLTVELEGPGGQRRQFETDRLATIRAEFGGTTVLIYVGEPSPYSVFQEIYFDFIPNGNYVNAGIWTFRLLPRGNAGGPYQMYLPSSEVRNANTRFFRPSPEFTLTIPSTAEKVITVAAYDALFEAYADFSGRGYVYTTVDGRQENVWQLKPDLAAPGVDILAPAAGGPYTDTGGYVYVTGTSFATPIVTGSAALMMEWGIVRANDPFLYGEKIKAYLRKGAQPLRGETQLPNERVGYGALCVRESIPI